jgi:hypothetical protein
MHTHSLADYVTCLDRNDLQGVGELMLSSARKLAAAAASSSPRRSRICGTSSSV